MQIPFCNFPMQIPMQISNANFLCNSLFAISNAIVNANFQCKFPTESKECKFPSAILQISFAIFFAFFNAISFAHLLAKQIYRGRQCKGGVKVLRLRDQLGVSGDSYPVLPGHPLPSSRTLLFRSKPPLPSAARRCPVLPQLPQQCSPLGSRPALLAQLQDAPVQF